MVVYPTLLLNEIINIAKSHYACRIIVLLTLFSQINQSVFTVCPSRPDVRPGMILTFEVFLLRGNVVNTDRVVAWGVFPISNSDFNIIEGSFRGVGGGNSISSSVSFWLAFRYFST